MFCVGLTGGIGAGKSTVTKLFKKLNVPVIDCDQIAHKMTEQNTQLFRSIVKHFGRGILDDNGQINRRKLRSLVFSNQKEKKWIEKLLHPVILATMKENISQIDAPYCLLVIPLLAESMGKFDFIDRICVIDTSEASQIERTIKRDNITKEEIKNILAYQASRTQRLKIADDIIYNEGDLSSLHQQIEELHQKYLQLSNT